ncbi:MAG: hypothetical protein HY558_06465 [Euryarchaeota archaeon]|nr:hypothetical protein [Euryarchaeota archaeon]
MPKPVLRGLLVMFPVAIEVTAAAMFLLLGLVPMRARLAAQRLRFPGRRARGGRADVLSLSALLLIPPPIPRRRGDAPRRCSLCGWFSPRANYMDLLAPGRVCPRCFRGAALAGGP